MSYRPTVGGRLRMRTRRRENALGLTTGNPGIWFPLRRLSARDGSQNGARRQEFATPRQTTPRLCLLCAVLPADQSRRGLRREPDVEQFLRLVKDENQMAVDKTS